MAIVAYFELPGVTQEQYDGIVDKLTDGGGLNRRSDWPVEGLVCHVAGPTDTGWRVVDVWESREAFESFGRHLVPIMGEFEVGGEPAVFPVHNVVTE